MRKVLSVKPFTIQLVQDLKPNDLPQGRIFGEWALGRMAKDPHFYRKVVLNDVAHFGLNRYVNKQNCQFWSEDQAEELHLWYPRNIVWL